MNIEKFWVDFKSKNTPIEIIGDIVNWKVDVKCKCLLCNEEFYITPANLKRGSIHNKCSYILRGKNKKSSTQLFKEKLLNVDSNIEVIGEYIKALLPIEVKCSICGNIWSSTPNNLLRGHGCPICKHKNANRDTKELEIRIDEMCQNTEQRFPNLIILNNPHNVHEKFDCQCKTCNTKWKTSLRNLNRIQSDECCPFCSGRIIDIEKLNVFLNNNKISINSLPAKWEDVLNCTCLNCGYTWNMKTNSLLNSKGCPHCNKNLSNGEYIIEKFLKKFKINYQKYKTFDSLCGVKNRKLSYDFYLKDKNMLIEFQGRQHYECVDIFGGEDQFKIQQEHDKRKRQYAKDNNINLLEIAYWDLKNIEKILSRELSLTS